MEKITNLEKIKEVAVIFLYLTPKLNEDFPMFVEHPFFSSPIILTLRGEPINIFSEPDKFKEHRKELQKTIQDSESVTAILMMLQIKYYLTFLKHIKPYLNNEDFSELLAHIWVTSENPNQDTNVKIKELIAWFKEANQNILMSSVELSYYNSLPDLVTIYRGVAVGRAEQKGLSWTCNLSTAEWFSHRFDQGSITGYIIKATIHKSDIFAYFNDRKEDELVCDSSKIYDMEIL